MPAAALILWMTLLVLWTIRTSAEQAREGDVYLGWWSVPVACDKPGMRSNALRRRYYWLLGL